MRFGFADCVYDSGTREVTRAGRAVALPPKALDLLELLIRSRPNAVAKGAIHERLWPGTFVSDASVANAVAELRAALGDDARSPAIIRTVHRFGYAFVADVRSGSLREKAEERGAVECRIVWDGAEIHLRAGENLIGRDPDAAIWIDDAEVSRRHAMIVIEGEGAAIEDLGSKNGTKLKGRKISGAVALSDRDEIGVGPATLIFRMFQRTGPTETADAGAS